MLQLKPILLLFLTLSVNVLFSQIDPEHLDTKLLEHKIKSLIDSVRIANNRNVLANDSILFIASQHHANYMQTKKILAHEEVGKKGFESPQSRAMSFGATENYLVGENVAFSHINTNVKSKNKLFLTYNLEELARSLVHSWVNSKGHFKNIIDSTYNTTGLAISIDKKTGKVYACQKFAKIMYQFQFDESKTLFPYSDFKNDEIITQFPKTEPNNSKNKYPFGLKDDKTQLCNECFEQWNNFPMMSVSVNKGNFILRIEDADFVKQIIQNRKDGFAVEIVPYDAYAVGNNAYYLEDSRRNQQLRTNGLLLEPKYRKDLQKGFKKRKINKDIKFVNYILNNDSIAFFKRFGSYNSARFSASYFQINLGKVPKNTSFWWNHNLVYIKDKQICHFTYFTSYEGKPENFFTEVPYYPPIPLENYLFKEELYSDSLKITFKSGETSVNAEKLKPLIDQFTEKGLVIKKVRIEAKSSVEGTKEGNEIIHQERANAIFSILKNYCDSSATFKLNTETDWKHFKTQTAKSPEWKFLSTMKEEEILDYFKNPKNKQPETILAQERTATIYVTGIRPFNKKNCAYYVVKEYNYFK